MRCLIATVGADAPGTNAVIRSLTQIALRRSIDVFGAKQGWLGLLRNEFWKLRESDVAQLLTRGGSVLGSTDTKIERSDLAAHRSIAETLKKFDLVVATGGLGSFSVLDNIYATQRMGMTTTMFVPASVEGEFLDPKHIAGTAAGDIHAESVGADTAGNRAVTAIDCLRDQAFHSRTVFLVECVGAKSNFQPLQIGTACGAHRIYLPLHPRLKPEEKREVEQLYGQGFDPNYVDVSELVRWIERSFTDDERKYLLVILPSGVPLLSMKRGDQPLSGRSGASYEAMITSIKPLELTVLRVAEALDVHFSGKRDTVQVRHVLVDDLQRGGPPTFKDRMLGTLYGEAAIEEFISLTNRVGVDTTHRGNLNLLTIDGTSSVGWKCHAREKVAHLFRGEDPRSGGLSPLPFLRQACGNVAGFRPYANI